MNADSGRIPQFGILSIAVHPDRQGLGLGTRLMEEAESLARQRGFSQIWLTVDPANEQGIAFYRRLQWRPVAISGRWRGLMTKQLSSEHA
jgi:ribosomal protein S18 acetylase RimI-like enzyme